MFAPSHHVAARRFLRVRRCGERLDSVTVDRGDAIEVKDAAAGVSAVRQRGT